VREREGKVIGLLGFDGGALRELCDVTLHINTRPGEYGPVEDLHLILNHFPVVTAVLGLPLFLVAILRRSGSLRAAALGVFVAAGALALPAYFTGEPAEEKVGHLPGVSEDDIGRHEEAAEVAAVVVGLQGLAALVALFLLRRRPGLPAPLTAVLLVLSVAGAVLMARTANLGGLIRHSEIRSGASAAPRSLP
jgi:uncharacterized membrane protein